MMYAVGILAFKSVKGLAPSYLSGRFGAQSSVHDRNIRNTNSLINDMYQLIGQRTFLYRAISAWNSLPHALTDSSCLRTFKKDLKIF